MARDSLPPPELPPVTLLEEMVPPEAPPDPDDDEAGPAVSLEHPVIPKSAMVRRDKVLRDRVMNLSMVCHIHSRQVAK